MLRQTAGRLVGVSGSRGNLRGHYHARTIFHRIDVIVSCLQGDSMRSHPRIRYFTFTAARSARAFCIALATLTLGAALPLRARAQQAQQRSALAEYFATQVDREDMVRIPMRDGKRLNASFFFAKNKARQNLPTILTFFPYLIDPTSGENRKFLENGYALAYVNVRGRYFSEGVYTYLGGSGPDSYDAIDFISKQPWSNGKVGALGCSSSAEEQHRMNSMHHPAFAAAVPRSSGAGIGHIGPYNEMGNFYRGGIFQNVWLSWYYGAGFKY